MPTRLQPIEEEPIEEIPLSRLQLYLFSKSHLYFDDMYVKDRLLVYNCLSYPANGCGVPYSFYHQSWEEQVAQWRGNEKNFDGLLHKFKYAPYFHPQEPLRPYIEYGKWYDPLHDDNRHTEFKKKRIWKYELSPTYHFYKWVCKNQFHLQSKEYFAVERRFQKYPKDDIDYSRYRIPPVEFYHLDWKDQVEQWNSVYSKEKGYIKVLFSDTDERAQFRNGRKIIPGPEYYKHEYRQDDQELDTTLMQDTSVVLYNQVREHQLS
jgi:hypothetical protein